MKRTQSTLIGLFLLQASTIGQDFTQSHARIILGQFTGEWTVNQVLWRPNTPADTSQLNATIKFTPDSTVLLVLESTPDGQYQFIGHHSFDDPRQRYLNWAAATNLTVAWAEGRSHGPDIHFKGYVHLVGTSDSLSYRGIWKAESKDRHVYTAWAIAKDGSERMIKRSLYTRRNTSAK